MVNKKSKLRIIPLGGLQEIGKNITAFEFGEDIIVVDCGITFPEDEMLGIDLVIPDFTYLVRNKDKVKAVLLTHGHEDHIGAVPYLLKQLNVPIYGTRLTLGLVEYKLKEHGLLNKVQLRTVDPGDKIALGNFTVDYISVTHSIAGACALAIHTPIGTVVHSGDFKVDHTPIQGQLMDFYSLAKLGHDGVLALLCESTNAEKKGYTMSEKIVGKTLDEMFREASDKRIIIATFASNVHRVQQVVDAAIKFKRKVAVSGRSMVNVVNTATELGYLNIPEGILIDIDQLNNYPVNQLVLITTGSQGEPMAALSRMASSDHRKVDVGPTDLVILSSSPIPGNERTVSKVINALLKKGAEVIHDKLYDIHVSGHAYQEELKLMHALIKPKFFIPVHGEFRHLKQHSLLAQGLGMPKENIFIANIGSVIELTEETCKLAGTVPAGKVLVDGLGVGDVGNIVLRDRKHLSQDGLIVVVVTIERESAQVMAGPDIISRGFVYVRESESLMENARTVVKNALYQCEERHITEWATIKNLVKDTLRDYLYEKTKRKPMILPIIMEV